MRLNFESTSIPREEMINVGGGAVEGQAKHVSIS
jgi:hypothetical protein